MKHRRNCRRRPSSPRHRFRVRLRPLAQDKIVLKASDVHPRRLSDRAGGRRHGQETGSGDQRPPQHSDVSVDAARRREGSDRAGAGRRHRLRARVGRCARPGGRRPQRVQSAVPVPQHRAHAEGDRRPDRPGAARQGDQQSARASSACAGWMPARAASTTPRSRSRASPTSRA